MSVDLAQDFFSLFGIAPAFRLDEAALDRAYLDLQAQVHPDRYVHLSDTERRLSMQWATRVNEGYRILKKPLARALYLLELRGVDAGRENNTAMPADFLMEQMEWREAVAEARAAEDAGELDSLQRKLRRQGGEIEQRMAQAFGERRDDEAADLARRLMFYEKLQRDIDDALEALES